MTFSLLPGSPGPAPRLDVGGALAGWREATPSEADILVCVDPDAAPDHAQPVCVLATHLEPPAGRWDRVLVFTQAHAAVVREIVPAASVFVVLPALVPAMEAGARDRLLFASHPDRGLERLLGVWGEVYDAIGLPLAVAHDVRGTSASAWPLVNQPGVIVHDFLDDIAFGRACARSAAVLVPNSGHPRSRLVCWSAWEARAAGRPVVAEPHLAGVLPPGVVEVLTHDGPSWAESIRRARSEAVPASSLALSTVVDSWRAALEPTCDPVVVPARSPAPATWRPPRLVP